MVRVILAIERAGRSDAIPIIVTGVAFLAWAAFVYRTGWSPTAIASRLTGRRLEPQRAGILYWSVCVSAALFGLIGLIAGVALLL